MTPSPTTVRSTETDESTLGLTKCGNRHRYKTFIKSLVSGGVYLRMMVAFRSQEPTSRNLSLEFAFPFDPLLGQLGRGV